MLLLFLSVSQASLSARYQQSPRVLSVAARLAQEADVSKRGAELLWWRSFDIHEVQLAVMVDIDSAVW